MELTKEQKERANNVIKNLCQIDDENITDETQFSSDLGLDGLDMVELIMEIEAEFSMLIPDENYDNIETVKELYGVIATQLKAKNNY